jgi:two-component system, OmpR family, response regulator CpxR
MSLPAKPRLLLVDDDVELCDLLTQYLGGEGFEILAVHDAPAGIAQALAGDFALVILDVMLPGGSGIDVLRRIRAGSQLPVLMLTARGDDVDRIVGLELGADDYLPKPFNSRELVARIHAILRRAAAASTALGGLPPAQRITVGDLELDGGARTVRRGGALVELTGVEFTLLEVLMHAAGRAVPRAELFQSVLGRREMAFDRSLDMHVSNLRKKLGPRAGAERIKTLRGIGYILVRSDGD